MTYSVSYVSHDVTKKRATTWRDAGRGPRAHMVEARRIELRSKAIP